MPRFGKNVLSQYLRTKCDKQLMLSLYNPTELEQLQWPVPLTARPAVQILRDVGIEWEQAKLTDLEVAFPTSVLANKRNGKFDDTDLLSILGQRPASPAFILQPSFGGSALREAFLRSIGVETTVINLIPQFTDFRPDIIWVQTRRDDEVEILPTGDLCNLGPSDQRKALIICDIKHAGEANSSYSSEVTLYAILLANWLRQVGLHDSFFVSSRLYLWTRGKEVSSLSDLITTNPGATLTERTQALVDDLETVDFSVFFQTVDHFFKSDLPRVLATPDWRSLDWHVDSRCSACDFLGYRNWLSIRDRASVDSHRDHYCVTAAEDYQHLSRLATVTRGARRTLEQSGCDTVPQVASLPSDAIVFDGHNALKADRNHLPFRAAALISGEITVSTNTTTIDFPKWVDLEVFITVNFDPGTGLLTALGSEARFRQRAPFGQQSGGQRTWQAEAQTLLVASLTEERNIVISFLSRLAEIFSFAYDPNPQRGGPEATRTRTQLYFWDRRQFEELAKAIGRHLDSIVIPQNDRILRGLVWLFPPDQVVQDDSITLANPTTIMKTVVQRDLRLSVPHCLTLFNVAENYYGSQYPPHIPGSFYRDPFSDMIPRERIYEIWSGEPLVRVGNEQKTRSQCISAYSDAIKDQVVALRSIVWKFRNDMRGRLSIDARALSIGTPFNFQRMSEDGRLWYAWARLEEACDTIELRHIWTEEPERLEASYEILRFSRLVRQTNDELTYEVRPSSRDCKFRDTEAFLTLQSESIPGFPDLRFCDVAPTLKAQRPPEDWNRRMSDIFQATLIDFDRNNLLARIELTGYGNAPAIRQLLFTNGMVDLRNSVSLVPGSGPPMSERVRECLVSIGRPPIAAAAVATYQALGHAPRVNPPANDPVTPVARVLWDAGALSVESSGVSTDIARRVTDAIERVEWPCNSSQRAAIEHCLTRRLSIVWGPPGTGKTTTAAALIAARILVAKASGQSLRMLITGPTYSAWEKLFNEVLTLLNALSVTDVACYRVYSASHSTHGQLPVTTFQVTDVSANRQDADFTVLTQRLDDPNGIVIVGTVANQCYRIAKLGYDTAQHSCFDFVVIDESSQLDVAKALFPLCLMSDDAGVVLFGDHLQMPPVVRTQPPREASWLVGSIQTYLIHRSGCQQQALLTNYRAAQPFVDFGKRIGYPPGLASHSPTLKLSRLVDTETEPTGWNDIVYWFDGLRTITEPDRRLAAITYADGRSGQANEFEADLVCSIVQQLFLTISQSLANELDMDENQRLVRHSLHTPDTFWNTGIGIVTPHRAQRSLIVRRLRQVFPSHPADQIDAAVDTVERFQGGQRDTIIISFGVGDPDLIADEEDFLLQLERTNVAISRARAKCILMISDDLAYHLPSDRETLLTSKAVKAYVSDFCRATTGINVPVESGSTRDVTLRWH